MSEVKDPFARLTRNPVMSAEQLIINAYKPVRWVSEVRVRWKPAREGSKNPFGHFVLVQLVFGGEADQAMEGIKNELGVRVAAWPIDICLETLSPAESLRRADFAVIMRRDWDWYYAHGYKVPGRISGREDVDVV